MATKKKPTTTMTTTDGRQIVDFTTWPTRSEVAARMGCSVSKVRNMQRDGTLTAHVDAEGTHRYNPDEVAQFAEELSEATANLEIQAADLKLSAKLLSNMTGPRGQIDAILVGTIQRQERRIEKLEGDLDRIRQERDEALDNQSERKVEEVKALQDEKRKTMLAEAFVQHVGRFLGGKPQSFLESLSVEQLEALSEVEGTWTDQQQRSLRAHLAKKKLSQNEAPNPALETSKGT